MRGDDGGGGLALRSKRYAAFWLSSLLSNMGTWMQSVAQPWLMLSLGASPFMLGLDAFVMSAPFWLLTLAGGVLADRRARDRIVYLFQGIQMLCPLLVVAGILGGWINVWWLVALSLVVGITDAISMPAFSALIPAIVRPRELTRALALNSIQFNLSRVLGPAFAGFVMLGYGALWCFGANAVSYVPFFLSVWFLYPRGEVREALAEDARGGFKAILADRRVRAILLSVFAAGFFCSPVITFSPVLIRDALRGDAESFGGAMTAFGLGGLLAPGLIFLSEKRLSQPALALGAAVLYGIATAAASQAQSVPQLALALVACGCLMTAANTAANTFLQAGSHEARRGKTASLYMLALRGGMASGGLAAGAAASLGGDMRAVLLAFGLLAVVAQGAISAAWRARPR